MSSPCERGASQMGEVHMKTLEEQIRYLVDLEEIKLLKYKYCHYNDGGWPDQPKSHQGPGADLFPDDGEQRRYGQGALASARRRGRQDRGVVDRLRRL